MKKTKEKDIILWVLIFIPYLLLIPAAFWYFNKLDKIDHSSFVIINKAEMTLYHYNYKGELLQKSPIATGKNFGNKENIGDSKTPEGVFKIMQVEDASSWTHDFKGDSLGAIAGAYGPYFIRLDVPGQKGIGIHGTHDNSSIGKRVSEGCIRMHNDDITQLVKNINTASVVVITPGIEDVNVNTMQPDTAVAKLTEKEIVAKRDKPVVKQVTKSSRYKILLKDNKKK